MTRAVADRVCEHCGAHFNNAGNRYAHKVRYCSNECRDARRKARNVGARGIIPVGRTFTRAHDGAVVMVFEDERGLPFVKALREMAYAQEVPGQ